MDSLIVVAKPVGDKTIVYTDGDVAPTHQTLLYFGDRLNYKPEEVSELIAIVNEIADATNPVTSKVIGKGTLGEGDDRIVILESREMNIVHEWLLDDGLIQEMLSRTEQHPNWIQHVTGYQNLKYGDYITFDRLCVWNGDEHTDFNFKYQTRFQDAQPA